jgi:hypothetical protein
MLQFSLINYHAMNSFSQPRLQMRLSSHLHTRIFNCEERAPILIGKEAEWNLEPLQ